MNQLPRTSPISDADAASLVSGGALADLARQITATPYPQDTGHRPASQRRRWLVGVSLTAGAAAAAVIAGFLVAQPAQLSRPAAVGSPRSSPVASPVANPAPAASAAQLVAYATRAAAAGPAFDPGPRQWIYTDVLYATSSAGAGGYLYGPPNERQDEKSWTRVDHLQSAYLKNGKLVVSAPYSPLQSQAIFGAELLGWPQTSYSYLTSLPTSPVPLAALIKANLRDEPNPIGAEGEGNLGVFNAIEALMQNVMVLPPKLLAALYGVLANDPVVHFERSVTDLAGRTGVGFYTVQEGYLKEQIVVNPKTYAYLGYLDVTVKAHTSIANDGTAHFPVGKVLGSQALLASGIVQRPGQLP